MTMLKILNFFDKPRRPEKTSMKETPRTQRKKSGHVGISYSADRDRWVAYINRDGKRVWTKRFKTLDEAVAARTAALDELAG